MMQNTIFDPNKPCLPPMPSEFLKRTENAVLEHLSNEQFGVSELADAVSMSRSNLLRKIKAETSLSASQYIRQIRLEEGMKLLKEGELNVSEVTHQVGFGSTSYFIKCFREHYGYPPGTVGKESEQPIEQEEPAVENQFKKGWINQALLGVGIILLLVLVVFFFKNDDQEAKPVEKSIAVLPFKNLSADSSNIYLINGLMETTLNNLQKIKDLRVVSRTSVEKFRNTTLTVPEISSMLPVGYFVEGSGQKVGDRIQLNIQLIEAARDKQVWSQQYNREVNDIFQLQEEIASSIVSEIQVVITPEERELIASIPTKNMDAYDLYLKGRAAIRKETIEGLNEGIPYFKQAIDLDNEFGLAYAYLAISYYYIDIFKTDKKYLDDVNSLADKALFYAPNSPESWIAKGSYYQQIGEYKETEKYFLQAHKLAPGSSDIVNQLSDFYTRYYPDTNKYLEFALKGVRLISNSKDSLTTSYLYLHLSNALIQNGFVDEALVYANKCLEYFPENPYGYIKPYILYVKNRDIAQTRNMLLNEFKKDTTRFDILQEIGKLYYCEGNFDKAYEVYDRFIKLRDRLGMDVYHFEYLKIADTFIRKGEQERGEQYIEGFKEFADGDKSRYKDIHYVAYYTYTGQLDSAEYHMKRFAELDGFQYWILLFIEDDPGMAPIKNKKWFKESLSKLRNTFWSDHEKLKAKLEEEDLI
ncbi:helix-turn-helix domain-containing protein [Marinoscillum pacificum]|uniref:helix-turn-helix domain-containing protein n=1 Tax=Marinoscillum pacificum TaxID=392723 RepID=UPI0021583159|nr:helix-turn-helix domain-containing protein [Marinoscillum pacificum]